MIEETKSDKEKSEDPVDDKKDEGGETGDFKFLSVLQDLKVKDGDDEI